MDKENKPNIKFNPLAKSYVPNNVKNNPINYPQLVDISNGDVINEKECKNNSHLTEVSPLLLKKNKHNKTLVVKRRDFQSPPKFPNNFPKVGKSSKQYNLNNQGPLSKTESERGIQSSLNSPSFAKVVETFQPQIIPTMDNFFENFSLLAKDTSDLSPMFIEILKRDRNKAKRLEFIKVFLNKFDNKNPVKHSEELTKILIKISDTVKNNFDVLYRYDVGNFTANFYKKFKDIEENVMARPGDLIVIYKY